jgi:hypothetical protein
MLVPITTARHDAWTPLSIALAEKVTGIVEDATA